MPLIIGTTPNSQWQALTPLLNHLGWENQQEDPETGYQSPRNIGENIQYLLLHSRPELAVAHAMDAGASPEDALAQWKSAAEQLLSFYERHFPSAVMVDAGSAALATRSVTEWLRENHSAFYDRAQAPWPEDAPELSIPAPGNPLHQLLATQLVVQDQGLAGLLAQLEAASVPLTDSTQPELDVAALHSELEQQKNAPQWEQDCAHAKAELSKAKAENNRLNQSLAGLQAELTQTKAQLEKASHAHETTEQQQQALKQESDILLNQLHKVQEELENYYHKAQNGNKTSKELEAQNEQLAEQKQALETELQSTQRELAQQKSVAAAAEEALNKARSQNEEQHKDVLEENELLLIQLHNVQEELERYYLENKDSAAKLVQANADLTGSQKSLKDVEKKLKTTQKSLDSAQSNNKALENNLKSSEQQTVTLQAELNSAKTLAENISRQLQEMQRAKEQLQKERDDLGVENYQLSSELALANIELKSARKKMHFVEQSTSWRLTTPLRKAAKLVNKSSRGRELVESHIQLIRQSDLFDAKWYLNNNSDLKEKGIDPAEHYIMYGGKEGRAPSPNFNAREYLKKYPDVSESGQNPLVHYLLYGKAEGRKI